MRVFRAGAALRDALPDSGHPDAAQQMTAPDPTETVS